MLGARTGLKHATFVVESSQSALAFWYSRADTPVPILVARAGTNTYHKLVLDAGQRGLPIVFDPDAVALMSSRGHLSPEARARDHLLPTWSAGKTARHIL
jgi:type III secretory pathway component EscU